MADAIGNSFLIVAGAGAAVGFLTVCAFVADPDRPTVDASDDLSLTVGGDVGLLDPVFALVLVGTQVRETGDPDAVAAWPWSAED
jgi:hypothetical protein